MPDEDIKDKKLLRGVLKRQITILLNKLENERHASSFIQDQSVVVKSKLSEIVSIDRDIIMSYSDESSVELDQEVENQTLYHFEINERLCSIIQISNKAETDSPARASVTNEIAQRSAAKPHEVRLPCFSGSPSDTMSFGDFFRMFDDLIGARPEYSDNTKLIYLKSYLRGSALDVIKYLSNCDANFNVAVDLLKKEFLDENVVVERILSTLTELRQPAENDYDGMDSIFRTVRSSVYELKNYELDALDEGSFGCKLLSFLLMKRLPCSFKLRLSLMLECDYPSVTQLIDNASLVVRSLRKSGSPSFHRADQSKMKRPNHEERRPWMNHSHKPDRGVSKHSSNRTFLNSDHEPPVKSTVQAFITSLKSNAEIRKCKLCNGEHSMLQCSVYQTPVKRIQRLEQLGLCTQCSGRHEDQNCPAKSRGLSYPCFKCKSVSHITAVCDKGGESANNPSTRNNLCLLNSVSSPGKSLLPSISVMMYRDDDSPSEIVRCLVDPGSQASYISSELADNLNLRVQESTTLDVRTFIGVKARKFGKTDCCIHVTAQNRLNAKFLVDPCMNLDYEVPGACSLIQSLMSKNVMLADSFYRNIQDDKISGFHCLLGADLLEHLEPLKTKCINNGVVYTVPDGVVLFGDPQRLSQEKLSVRHHCSDDATQVAKVDSNDDSATSVNLVMNGNCHDDFIMTDNKLDHELHRMFTLEGVGISEEVCSVDEECVKRFDDSIERLNGKYHVMIPFLEKVSDVPSAYTTAMASLQRVKHSLARKELTSQYTDVFHQLESQGIIEEVSQDASTSGVYIPHHPVVKNDDRTTTKIRPVFNCSAKPDPSKPSLNEACYKGVDLINDLVKLLIKFRKYQYTVVADIEKAFLQIFLKSEDDKDRFRFLWDENGKVKIFRFKTLLFGLNCSPFILARVINHHLGLYDNNAVAEVIKSHLYVDNLLYSTPHESDLFAVYAQSREIMSEGGFNLRSWTSNYPVLRTKMLEDETYTQHGEATEKLLGYQYDPINDELSLADFDFSSKSPSKRTVLSDVSRVYDPLSVMCPVTVSGRLFIQELWKRGVDWDEPLHDDAISSWNKIKTDLQQLNSLRLPRMVVNCADDRQLTMHIFTDGSQKAYGFVCYVCANDRAGLVYAKSKVAPGKKSIPQLELLAVHLAFRSLRFLLDCYHVHQIFIWIDAQVVLSWLSVGYKTNNKFSVNRIKEVISMRKDLAAQDVTVRLHYVETSSNPADLLTRGISFNAFQNQMRFWLEGPDWLSDESQWPQTSYGEPPAGAVNCLTSTVHPRHSDHVDCVVDISRFSSFRKLLRVAFLVFTFIRRLRKMEMSPGETLTYLIKSMQSTSFVQEIQYLTKPIGAAPPLVRDLNLFIDTEGVVRAKGRINRLNMYSYAVLRPTLLAKHHHLTVLIVNDAHVKCKHLGIGTTLSIVRQDGYWIPAGRQVVKSIISKCVLCTRFNAFSFQYPKMTNLPEERLQLIKPFLHTAIDYTGPLYVFDSEEQPSKVFVALFTCMAIRAVHLELVKDLSCQSFVLAFKRFCNVYVIPETVYTDNGTYFVSGMKYVSKFAMSGEFQEHLHSLQIKHDTIPAYASWAGGIYERQIRTLKQCLLKSIGRSKVSYDDLLMHLSDIQNAINNRPITYMYSDIDEVLPLTPNMMLKVHSNKHMRLSPDSDEADPLWSPQIGSNVTHENLNETFQRQVKMFDDFKQNWYSSYLLSLRETSRDIHQAEWSNRIKVGDIVLVNTKDQSRIHWQMGRVTRLLHSDDGKVRSVLLRMPRKSTARYAVNHLYPLELQATHAGNTQSSVVQLCDDSNPRQQRSAAVKQGKMMRQLIDQGQL